MFGFSSRVQSRRRIAIQRAILGRFYGTIGTSSLSLSGDSGAQQRGDSKVGRAADFRAQRAGDSRAQKVLYLSLSTLSPLGAQSS